MSDSKKVQHESYSRMLVLEQWQVALCVNDCIAASVLSFLLAETKDAEEGAYLPFTIEQIKNGVFGLASEKTIRNAIDKLEKLDLLKVSNNPNKKYKFDRRHFYSVNIHACKAFAQKYCYVNEQNRSGKFTKSNINKNNNTANNTLPTSIVNFNNCVKWNLDRTNNTNEPRLDPINKKFKICADDTIREQLSSVQIKFVKSVINNLITQHKVIITNPNDFYDQFVFSILNAEQLKGKTSFTNRVNIIAKLTRTRRWTTPIGYYKHSEVGRKKLDEIKAIEQAEINLAKSARDRRAGIVKASINVFNLKPQAASAYIVDQKNDKCDETSQINIIRAENTRLRTIQDLAIKIESLNKKIEQHKLQLEKTKNNEFIAVIKNCIVQCETERKLLEYELIKVA